MYTLLSLFSPSNLGTKIMLTCDNWPKSKPEEKISMQMENMMVKQNNDLPDDVQSGGDVLLSPTIIKNSFLSDPEIPISEGVQIPEISQIPEKSMYLLQFPIFQYFNLKYLQFRLYYKV